MLLVEGFERGLFLLLYQSLSILTSPFHFLILSIRESSVDRDLYFIPDASSQEPGPEFWGNSSYLIGVWSLGLDLTQTTPPWMRIHADYYNQRQQLPKSTISRERRRRMTLSLRMNMMMLLQLILMLSIQQQPVSSLPDIIKIGKWLVSIPQITQFYGKKSSPKDWKNWQ